MDYWGKVSPERKITHKLLIFNSIKIKKKYTRSGLTQPNQVLGFRKMVSPSGSVIPGTKPSLEKKSAPA